MKQHDDEDAADIDYASACGWRGRRRRRLLVWVWMINVTIHQPHPPPPSVLLVLLGVGVAGGGGRCGYHDDMRARAPARAVLRCNNFARANCLDHTWSSFTVFLDLRRNYHHWRCYFKSDAFWNITTILRVRAVARTSCFYCIDRLSLKRGFEWWCHCRFWSKAEFGFSILDSRHSDCRGRFSWVDWQKIDIWPCNYSQLIERNETIPKRHYSPRYNLYKPRY